MSKDIQICPGAVGCRVDIYMYAMTTDRGCSVAFLVVFASLHLSNHHSLCHGFRSCVFSGCKTTTTRKYDNRLHFAKPHTPVGRREILSLITLPPIVVLPQVAPAAEDAQDLISQMFNPDGSLKEGVKDQAKSRVVDATWPFSEERIVNIDGINASGGSSTTGPQVRVSYQLPEKWEAGDPLYLDRTEGVNRKACNRITVYQAPGLASEDRLQKATNIGVANALDVTGDLKALQHGDLIGGRKQEKDDQTYFEFDMAVAPDTCGESQKNLGLGFCPYESIVLLSSTIVEQRLYVLAIECDDTQWKQENSDIKRVRSSFNVAVL